MLLKEFFSPLGSSKEDDQDIDWIDDLKFFIDNDSRILSNHFFPAIKKHEKYIDHPEAFKIYLKPVKISAREYCKTFNIKDPNEKFSSEDLVNLAKKICDEQRTHIKNKDYENQ